MKSEAWRDLRPSDLHVIFIGNANVIDAKLILDDIPNEGMIVLLSFGSMLKVLVFKVKVL